MALSENISHYACRLVGMLGSRCSPLYLGDVVGCSFSYADVWSGTSGLFVKFLLLFMSKVQRNTSEIVDSVRPMLIIGPLSPSAHMSSAC